MSKANTKMIGILAAAVIAIVAVLGFAGSKMMGSKDNSTETASKEATKADEIATSAGNGSETSGQQNSEQNNAEDPVVAKVDGSDIRRSDVIKFMKSQNIELSQQNMEDVYPLALEQVIRGQIVINKASKANLDNDEEVQKQLEAAKKHVVNTVFLQRTVDTKITDDVMKAAYDGHIKKMPDTEERRARHILVDSEEKAKEIISSLKSGKSFEEQAKQFSKDPVGPNGGDLGYFTKDQMVPEFADASFKMKKGEISETPVKTEFGYHVIKVEDIRQKPKPTFEEMKPYLQVQLRQEVLNELIDEWQKNAAIERFDMNGKPIEPASGEETKPEEVPAPAKEAAPEEQKPAE